MYHFFVTLSINLSLLLSFFTEHYSVFLSFTWELSTCLTPSPTDSNHRSNLYTVYMTPTAQAPSLFESTGTNCHYCTTSLSLSLFSPPSIILHLTVTAEALKADTIKTLHLPRKYSYLCSKELETDTIRISKKYRFSSTLIEYHHHRLQVLSTQFVLTLHARVSFD